MTHILGQDNVLQKLTRAYNQQRIASAYLFTGPSGVGKRTVATWFAMYLNCLATDDQKPCQHCSSCRKIKGNNHIDVWTIEGEKGRLKIAQIRELQAKVRFAPQDGLWRVVLVQRVEEMTIEASNAFLKILEEPPPNNLFLLTSSASGQLLPTIISRCQRVGFSPLPNDIVANLLQQHFEMDAKEATRLATFASGSIKYAIHLKDAFDESSPKNDFFSMLSKLHDKKQGPRVALNLAEKIVKENLELYFFLLRTWFRDIYMIKEASYRGEQLYHVDLETQLQQKHQQLSDQKIFACMTAIEDAELALKQHAVPLLTLETMFLKMI